LKDIALRAYRMINEIPVNKIKITRSTLDSWNKTADPSEATSPFSTTILQQEMNFI